ncbi:histone PARylation factor 1 [Trichoplusia ni]|uniref:Histone PARylation factor 1 n=1 Tax=Trichoplusia ni TaxID=7111 RepID=A0A7E5X2L5_TRINI|nr:histone PARylation factor 1 [Trichoplusia ni]
MADEWAEYVKDPRMVCKYASKCYQKNPEHHKNFKHPPLNKRKDNRNKRRFSPYTRDSPRVSPNPSSKDESSEKTAGSDESNNKNETSVSEDSVQSDQLVPDLPKDITFYDKETDRDVLKELFLVEMPEDFFKFYECVSDGGKSFEDALASVNLVPIGPYELIIGKLPKLEDKELYLAHWRFFYDPPEYQAVLKKSKTSEYHIGYFRDDPDQTPVFVASNDSKKDCRLAPMAENIFGAVYQYLQNEKKQSPFTSMACQKLMEKIKAFADENKISLEEYTMKKRSPHMVTRSFHGAGIVVPYNKKTQLGYRHLVETDANLKKLFASLEKASNQNDKDKILSELQPVITYASIAVDESDFGTGVEVGIALFCSGLKELEPSALSSLTAAYSVLNRSAFAEIIKAHLKYRRKGPNMSVLSFKK